ncbi:MAG: PepSY domain-containing protein [Opitutaceae bacterium]
MAWRRSFPAWSCFASRSRRRRSRIAIPAPAQSQLVLTVLHRGAPVWRKFSRAEFDPATGELLRIRRASTLPWRDQLNSMLAPLHFGLYGSAATKWLYAIGGLSPAVLAITGLLIARQRRARRSLAG